MDENYSPLFFFSIFMIVQVLNIDKSFCQLGSSIKS